MSLLRLSWRLPAMVAVTAWSALALVLILPFRRLAERRHLAWRNRIFRSWARTLARIMGMRMTVRGTPPSGAFYLVANHLSYLDIMLIAAHVDAAFVAKADLRGWPLLGQAFQVADTIFIDRGRRRDVVRVMDRMAACLQRGLGVVVFPEGTSGSGGQLLRFKPSLLELPARDDLPVCWAVLGYRGPPGVDARNTLCWWGDAPFLGHILRLLRLPSFDATVRFGASPLGDGGRKALADRLYAAMSAAFTPIGSPGSARRAESPAPTWRRADRRRAPAPPPR